MTRILFNGEPTEQIPVMDRGLHYGDGLFETLRVQAGRLPLWPWHWRRLQHGCERLGIPLPEEATLLQEIGALVGTEQQAVLKLILTRGPGQRGYAVPEPMRPSRLLILSDWPDYPADYRRDGVRVYTCQTRLGRNPALAGIKHLNRLEQVLARREWSGRAYQEGVLCDTEGHVIEGTMSNLFWCKRDQLYTPDLASCGVTGVMREIVIDLAHRSPISTKIGLWPATDLADADEVFMTNSLIGIWPVSYIFNKSFQAGPVTLQLQSMLQAEYAI